MKLFWKGQDNPAMLASGARYNYLGFNDVLPKLLGITGKLVYQPVSRRGSLGLYATCFSSGLCWSRGHSSVTQKWLFAFVSGTLAVMIMAKFGDGLSQSGSLGSFVRIGWGDSLNRMSLYLIPGVVALLILRAERARNHFEAKSNR
jgi:hypothetical protein